MTYDVRPVSGSAHPTLLMIGSPMDASGFADLAARFADRTAGGCLRQQRRRVNALALVARHPDLVRVLVAHEPPAAQALPGRENALAAVVRLRQIYDKKGSGAGIAASSATTQ